MFDVIGKIFGSKDSMNSLVDSVSNGLDKLVYTNEEQADDAAQERKAARANVVEWIAASSGSRVARRFIAMVVTLLWAFSHVASLACGLVAVWSDNPGWLASQTAIAGSADTIQGAMMLVLGFYFAAPFMGDIAKGAMQKFAGKQ